MVSMVNCLICFGYLSKKIPFQSSTSQNRSLKLYCNIFTVILLLLSFNAVLKGVITKNISPGFIKYINSSCSVPLPLPLRISGVFSFCQYLLCVVSFRCDTYVVTA